MDVLEKDTQTVSVPNAEPLLIKTASSLHNVIY